MYLCVTDITNICVTDFEPFFGDGLVNYSSAELLVYVLIKMSSVSGFNNIACDMVRVSFRGVASHPV